MNIFCIILYICIKYTAKESTKDFLFFYGQQLFECILGLKMQYRFLWFGVDMAHIVLSVFCKQNVI